MFAPLFPLGFHLLGSYRDFCVNACTRRIGETDSKGPKVSRECDFASELCFLLVRMESTSEQSELNLVYYESRLLDSDYFRGITQTFES